MKYVLVHWTATNETTILTEDFVRDKTMLKDDSKEGMIRFGKLGRKEPKGECKAYLGRIIDASERKQLVEFLGAGSGKSSFLMAQDDTPRYRKIKRKISSSGYELSDDTDVSKELHVNSKKKVTCARKVAQERAFEDIIGRTDPYVVSEDEFQHDIAEVDESKQQLREKIKDLQQELLKEKSLVKQLQNANVMLQKSLSNLVMKTCKEAISQSFGADEQIQNNKGSLERPSSPLLGQRVSPAPLSQRRGSFSAVNQQPQSPLAFGQHPGQSPSPFHLSPKSPSPLLQRAKCPSPCIQQQGSPSTQSTFTSEFDDQTSNGDADDHHSPRSSIADSVQISEILNSTTERKMTMVLMSILFERKVLAVSSVTGKSKEGRPALSPEEVQLITRSFSSAADVEEELVQF